jgi:hypothetical protein
MQKINNIREFIKDALQRFGIHYEEITASSIDEGKTIVLAKRNCPALFEDFIQFIKQEGFKYNSYFCPTRNRIKIDVSI